MIYLDCAATSLEKPSSVVRAVTRALTTMASPGRGAHSAARRAADTVFRCREAAGRLFHVEDVSRVVLTTSATHGLNIAIRTLVRPGGRVVISPYEHNAVTRTLHAIPGAAVRVASAPLFDSGALVESFRCLLAEGADAAVCTHVSNVFGYVLPLEEIAGVCREAGVPLVVDAAQSAGVLPLDFTALGAAFAAMPGHKGLYGPQGTGLLLCRDMPEPILFGGTGSDSINQAMPGDLPDRLEAGTANVPGAAGLLAGMEFVEAKGPGRLLRHERSLARRLGAGLAAIPGVEVFLPPEEVRCGVVSFRLSAMDCESAAEALGAMGLALRGGLHCAPLAHRTAGTLESGTLRASFSAFSHMGHIPPLLSAVTSLQGAPGGRRAGGRR